MPEFSEFPEPDEAGTTQVRISVRPSRAAGVAAADWVHSLRVVEGADIGRRYRVAETPLAIGRRSTSGLVVPDTEVSGQHCSIRSVAGETALEVTDLGSTNGTFAAGRRVRGRARLADGGLLQVGRSVLVHECRSRAEMERAEQTDRDLERARHYVESLLPLPIREGPVRTDWFFRPSATLGGDAFGYFRLDARRFAGYVIDVAGHGVGVAMHTVSLMNVLRQRALRDTDFADPAQVLTRLNAMFQMDEHDGLCFTMWYGVYDTEARSLAYASAGHHPALLHQAGQARLQRLCTRSLPLGALAESVYRAEQVAVAAGGQLFLFSDGLFEVTDRAGRQWSLDDVVPYFDALAPGDDQPAGLYRSIRKAVGDGPLVDDCSIVSVTFL